MIISCPNCKKKFKIDPSLLPFEGRELKCGSCDQVWFYKIEDKNAKSISLKEDVTTRDIVSDIVENKIREKIENELYIPKKKEAGSDENIDDKLDPILKDKNKENTGNKFFSYLVVFIISFITLVILVDTLKVPLINNFPRLEIILFNLFEILKDIKLFIIDLY